MDLSNLKPKVDTSTLELKHPVTGEVIADDSGKPFTVDVLLRHTKEYRDLGYEMADKRAARLAKAKKADTIEKTADTMSDIDDMIARSIKGYYLIENGVAVEYSVANTKRLLEDYPWIREQVLEEQQAYETFMKV
jgi:hypothetical protein